MRINTDREEVITSGKLNKVSKEYTLSDEGGQLFSIFSSSIYSDPIRAIVREVGTNAFDAHRDAGKGDVPFDIIMPTQFDSQIRFRDYGNGMTYDQVFDIFCVYGSSTKSGGSDDVGGFGIGSKSPFAYTSSFFVKTYQNGVMHVYENVMQTNGKPKLSHLIERETDEPDGVEISFNVEEKDFDKFEREVDYVCSFFPVAPNVINTVFEPSFDMAEELVEIKDKIYSFSRIPTNAMPRAKAYVRMGCVCYPIRDNEALEKALDDSFTVGVYDKYLFFDLDIDEVEVRPTREDLLYSDETVATLLRYIELADYGARKEIAARMRELRKMPLSELLRTPEAKADNWGSTHQSRYIHRRFTVKMKTFSGGLMFSRFSNIGVDMLQQANDDVKKIVGRRNEDGDLMHVNMTAYFRAVPLRDGGATTCGVELGRYADSKNCALRLTEGKTGTIYYEKRGCQKIIKGCNPHAEDTPDTFISQRVVIFKKTVEHADTIEQVLKFYFGLEFKELPKMSTAKNLKKGKELTLHTHSMQADTMMHSPVTRHTNHKFADLDDLAGAVSNRYDSFQLKTKAGRKGKFVYQPMDHGQPQFSILPRLIGELRADKWLPAGADIDADQIILGQKSIAKDLRNDNRFMTYEAAVIQRLLSYEPKSIDVRELPMDAQAHSSLAQDKFLQNPELGGVLFADIMKGKCASRQTEANYNELKSVCFYLKKIMREMQHRHPYRIRKNYEVLRKLDAKRKQLMGIRARVEGELAFLQQRIKTRFDVLYKHYPLLEMMGTRAYEDDKYVKEIKRYIFGKES